MRGCGPLIRGAETRSHRVSSKDTYTGDVPMTRLNMKMLSGESLLELDCLTVLDFKVEDMIDAVAQPTELVIPVAGKWGRWTPDFLVERQFTRPVFIEVKPISSLHERSPWPGISDAELKRLEHRNERIRRTVLRIRGMRQRVTELGGEFWLLTEHQIRLEPQLYNAEVMWGGLTAFIGNDWVAEAVAGLRGLPRHLTVEVLANVVPKLRDSAVNVACVLDRQGYIRLDRTDFFTIRCAFENRLSRSGGA